MSDKTILLVEDNPDDEALALRALKRNNIMNEVVVVRDGVEALEYLLATGGGVRNLPQVVLLDLKLPKLNGLQVLQRLRADARTELLPVVILTSSNEERDIVNAYSLGANSYVRSLRTELVDQLRRRTWRWLGHIKPMDLLDLLPEPHIERVC